MHPIYSDQCLIITCLLIHSSTILEHVRAYTVLLPCFGAECGTESSCRKDDEVCVVSYESLSLFIRVLHSAHHNSAFVWLPLTFTGVHGLKSKGETHIIRSRLQVTQAAMTPTTQDKL